MGLTFCLVGYMFGLMLWKKWLKVGTVGTVLIGGALLASRPHISKAEFDIPGLSQQVQNHEDRLNNHEARLDNVEKDVAVIQTDTGSKPAENKQIVPVVAVATPQPVVAAVTQPTPTPAPPVVTRWHAVHTWDSNCNVLTTKYIYEYNDGTVRESDQYESHPGAINSQSSVCSNNVLQP